MNFFSAKNRAACTRQLQSTQFDVFVIGGGITGAGIALDAACRGLKVALVDMQDFAAGTSGRSTKLIHGGLRYLKQFEFRLVAEVGKERKIIHRIAPHLTRPEQMLMPITKNGSFGKFSTRIGMTIYERLAGVDQPERHKMLSAAGAFVKDPMLPKDQLLGGVLFYEYRTDDARLTIEILKEAVNRGAVALNYVQVTGFTYDGENMNGATVKDQIDGREYVIHADYLINAAGPWVDELDAVDDKNNGNKLQITKGVHIVVDQKKLPVKQSVYFDTFDKRMVFVIPREGKTYIGTTDTFYNGDKVHPLILPEDKAYLLNCVNDFFPGCQLKSEDIESGWAGLRPLIAKPGKKPSEISRKDEMFTWHSGLITIAGGKLTGYRKMAQRVMDKIAELMQKEDKRRIPACSTDKVLLPGGKFYKSVSLKEFIKNKIKEGFTIGLTGDETEKLVSRFGAEVDVIFDIARQLRSIEKDHELSLALRAQLLYVIEHEMCMSPADFFSRRTGMIFFDMMGVKASKGALFLYMQGLMKWDETSIQRCEQQLSALISESC